MEATVIIPIWQVIVYAVLFSGSYAVIAYITRQNTKEIEFIRKTVVSLELYRNEMSHINSTLDEVKVQNVQILKMLTRTRT